MKFAMIGASGHLGWLVTKEALDRGHQVTALIRSDKPVDSRAEVLRKDVFQLERADVEPYDAVLSCFGSGFAVDPVVNLQICQHYVEIFEGLRTHLFHVVGAGCLFSDASHTTRNYELPGHPKFLKGVSQNSTLGLETLQRSVNIRWTCMIPSVIFDGEHSGNGKYVVGIDVQPLYNEDGKSIVTFDDFAKAMVDFAETDAYVGSVVTLLSK